MPREDSVCQYTIMGKEELEVKNLAEDVRFANKAYVVDDPKIRYYFGVPLTTGDGHNIGALCVIDKTERTIDPEKVELLKIIASEIVNRIKTTHLIENLTLKAKEATDTKLKVAHDIRGPLSGIIGLTQIVRDQGDQNQLDEVLQFVSMIQKCGNSILELADEILTTEKTKNNTAVSLQSNQFNLTLFKEKLLKLYGPQALNKKINFSVETNCAVDNIPFLKNKLLQITGNLISNSIKFTPENGNVLVKLDIVETEEKQELHVAVTDTGVGISEEKINATLSGTNSSTNGTCGEVGFGFGLSLVKHLIDSLKGNMHIYSIPGNGCTFSVCLPLVQN
jgi:signal transduction histidine kinase